MSRVRKIRVSPWTGAAAAAVFTLSAVAGQSAAVAATDAPSGYDWDQASYILTMRAGAIEPYALVPRDVPADIGYSYVDLSHDTGAPTGRCESESAAYWAGLEVEEGVLSPGASPPGEDGKATTGYKNPTHAHTVSPDFTPGRDGTTKPTIAATGPEGPLWRATCEDDAHGSAASDVLNVAGARAAGSKTVGKVDKQTGVYLGTSRAYIQGITGAGGFDAISSLMQVKAEPDKEPSVTYRLSLFHSDAGGAKWGMSQEGFTISGSNVPMSNFVDQFNSQSKAVSAALAAAGPSGLQIFAPVVGTSTDGGRYSITAPVVAGHFGLAAREGTIGQDQGVRFGSVTFSGVYGA